VVAGAVVALAFSAMWSGAVSPSLDQALESPPPAGAYRHDAMIFWHTYLKLTDGADYYPAFRDAAAGDVLLMNGGFVKDGKFTSWAFSAASIRPPYVFYLWRVLAPGGAVALLRWALLLAGLVLCAAFWALLPRVGPGAAVVAMLLVPYLQGMVALGGMFMPDIWAGLFVTLGMLVWTRKGYVAAGFLLLAGALCREAAAFALLVPLCWSVVRAVQRKPGWLRRALVLAGLTAVFAVGYALHLRAGAPFIAATQRSSGTILMMLRQSAARPLADRFVAPTAFGAAMFGLAYLPTWLPLVLQAPGWYVALRADLDALVVVLGYAAFWIVFSYAGGATSSYWGALYMPLAVIGGGALFAWVSAIGQSRGPIAWRLERAPAE